MDPIFLILCVVPLAAAGIQLVLRPATFSWREAVAQGALCTVLVAGVWQLGRYAEASDTEIWNGRVSATEAIQKDCPRGWVRSRDSHCTRYSTREVKTGETCTTKDGRRSCTPTYTTEYRYRFPWERRYWVVSDDIDLTLEYERVDSQGAQVPPMFAAVTVGDPAAKTMPYMNWVLGASASLFHEDGAAEEKYAALIPSYPITIYDGIKVDRVVTVGRVRVDTAAWSRDLSNSLGTLGPQRQMNAVVVLTDASAVGEDFPLAVRRAWHGFKKNDAVIFAGVDADLTLKWARVLSWSSASAFDNGLQNELLAHRGEELTSGIVNTALMEHADHYQRRSMSEFEYLKDSIPVPGWLYALIAILSIGGTAGLSFVFHRTAF